MLQPTPAVVGMGLDEVDTPALVVELDVFETNLDRMAAALAASDVAFRPHAKTHKSPEVALRQISRGVAGGVEDILVSNEVVGRTKLDRLAVLARRARIGVCVDDRAQIAALEEAAARAAVTVRVLVEVDVGAGRCGVLPSTPTSEKAERR